MAKIDSIDPWVPSAIAFGSQVVSGIGNYFENKNRVKYQNKVAQMQEDARKRIAEAQKKAVKRANFFSLMSGQNLQAEPVDYDLPVIPAYESGGWTKALRGVGQGLGYASQASDTLIKMQDYNESKATRAGEQAAAMHIADSQTSYELGPVPAKEEVERQARRIAQLRSIDADQAWENSLEADSSLSGMFSGKSDSAFKEAYATRIANANAVMKKTQDTNLRLWQANIEEAARDELIETNRKTAARTKADTTAATKQAEAGTDFTNAMLASADYKMNTKLLIQTDKIMALANHEDWQYDEDGNLTGIKLNAATSTAIFNLYQRTMDDGVVHEADINRIKEGLDTWRKQAVITLEALRDNEVATISPDAALLLIGHTEKLRANAVAHLHSSANARAAAYSMVYNNSTTAQSHGWTGRDDAYKTFKGIVDANLRQFTTNREGLDRLQEVPKSQVEFTTGLANLEGAALWGDPSAQKLSEGVEGGKWADIQKIGFDEFAILTAEDKKQAEDDAVAKFFTGVLFPVVPAVQSEVGQAALAGAKSVAAGNPPGAFIRRTAGTEGAFGRTTPADYSRFRHPVDVMAAGAHNWTAAAFETASGYGAKAQQSVNTALFGPAHMQNVRSYSPQGIMRQVRDDPATIALTALLYGRSYGQGPIGRGGGGGGGGGVSGLLGGGGSRVLPGGPYSGLGRGTGLNLPQGSSERIAYPNSRIWTGP